MSEWPLHPDEAPEQKVIAAIQEIFPDSEVLADNDGQVVIYTGLMWSGKHGENIAGQHNLELQEVNLSSPDCQYGYTISQINMILGARRKEFTAWMSGQTQTLCDGRKYNHETRGYEEACGGVAHGPVVYPWDLKRFLDGRPIID